MSAPLITIFNGRRRSMGSEEGAEGFVYAQFAVGIREHLHAFKGASLAVLMSIALHSDADGWAHPAYDTLCRETGYDEQTVRLAIRKLEKLTINGARVMLTYRPVVGKGNNYLLFPTGVDVSFYELGRLQTTNKEEDSHRPLFPIEKPGKNGRNQPDTTGKPTVVDSYAPVENPPMENPPDKYNQRKSSYRTLSKNYNHIAKEEQIRGSDVLEALIQELRLTGVYDAVDLEVEARKAEIWCRKNGRQFTVKLFTNWCNNAQRDFALSSAAYKAAPAGSGRNGHKPEATGDVERALGDIFGG